jgi:ribosomal protein S27E
MIDNQNQAPVWSPPPGYIQVDSQVPGVTVFAPQPEHKESGQPVSYACPNCGANTAFDVSAGGIACDYCGYIAPVAAAKVGRAAIILSSPLKHFRKPGTAGGTAPGAAL